MAKKEEICIEKISREMTQGKTTPYLCTDDENIKHIVKGRKATSNGLVKEWICARLGTAFGLPIPDFALAWADSPLQKIKELYEYNFASSFVENIQDVTTSTLGKLPKQLLKDLYFFDYWVRNNDRTLREGQGNPNFFYNSAEGNALVIDHNLAFDKEFELSKHKELHVSAPFIEWDEIFETERAYYTELIELSLKEMDNALAELPEEWLEIYSIDQINREILPILNQYKNDNFWEDIK
ncbi:HipA family kinase [Vibrio lentus]|uniref:HipA family kinase n=1 Tax=Vibrio lentus TaxID=136468 RepID=UPI00178D0007|nr:HipA family kinase [Vibrio lentus]MDN3631340.1 hypothetical protein [Vibrio lentus]